MQQNEARVELVLVTPEERPLGLFGPVASGAITELLAERNVEVHERVYPTACQRGLLSLRPEGAIAADRVVALPRLEGPTIAGVPLDPHGFIPTDARGVSAGWPTSSLPATLPASR